MQIKARLMVETESSSMMDAREEEVREKERTPGVSVMIAWQMTNQLTKCIQRSDGHGQESA